jgi:toxin HigB-1
VIKSFKSAGLRRFAGRGDGSRLNAAQLDRISRILSLLDDAMRLEDMNVPGLYFHGLKGKARGRHAVRVTGNWRITFGWNGQDIVDVDLEDYH